LPCFCEIISKKEQARGAVTKGQENRHGVYPAIPTIGLKTFPPKPLFQADGVVVVCNHAQGVDGAEDGKVPRYTMPNSNQEEHYCNGRRVLGFEQLKKSGIGLQFLSCSFWLYLPVAADTG
jgi:hypothetical protein